MATTKLDAQLEMHVFGSNIGESIVLKLPNDKWGVVDCYASNLADPSSNPVYQFLQKQDVVELEFLCMTHPHDDHFRGMSTLLQVFQVQYFWRPSVIFGKRLKWILRSSTNDEYSLENASELEKIFELVKKQKSESDRPLIPKNSSLGDLLYPVPLDDTAKFKIWAIAPSSNQIDNYEEKLHKCFDDTGRLKEKFPSEHHNQISMALLIEFGSTKIVLGGDVEKNGWEDCIKEFGIDKLDSTAVKISHHGSENGYCKGLWEGFSASQKPITVLTPFRKHRLPKNKAIEHIQNFSEQIVTPCLDAVNPAELPTKNSTNPAIKSRLALRKYFKAHPVPTKCSTGICSFTFDDQGNYNLEELKPPAGEITEK